MKIKNAIPEPYKADEAYMSILGRVSVRRYTDQPVSSDQMSAILHAAMSAPSGVNKQPWDFIVVDDRELLSQLADALPYAKMTSDAPVAIVVCGNRERFSMELMMSFGNRIYRQPPKIFFSRHMRSDLAEYGHVSIRMRNGSLR